MDYLDQQINGDPASWGNHHPVSGNKEEKYLKRKEQLMCVKTRSILLSQFLLKIR